MDLMLPWGKESLPVTLPGSWEVIIPQKPVRAVMGFLRAERGVDDITLPKDSKPLWLLKPLLRMMGPSRAYGFLEKVKKGLNVEEKFLVYYSMQLIRQYELFFYTPTLSKDEVKALGFFVPCADPAEVIRRGMKKSGSTPGLPCSRTEVPPSRLWVTNTRIRRNL